MKKMMHADPEQLMPLVAKDFYVVARELGHTNHDLPLWACSRSTAIEIGGPPGGSVERTDIPHVPGAFQLLNVLSDRSCGQFVHLSETLGYQEDAPVSLSRRVRHNSNLNWIVDESIDGPIWERCKGLFETSSFSGRRPLGLNARFRFYRYGEGDFFAPHTDGAWPGSRVVDGSLVTDAYGDRISEMTCLIFLTDGYEGGRTLLHTGRDAPQAVSTPKGAALCFPHGIHPDHCVHSSEEIMSGQKYIIRTDILFG